MRCLVVLVALVALSAVARADNPKQAEKYFRLGEKAYKAQDFASAAESFHEAYRNLPLPEIAFSAAQAYRRLYRVDPKPEHVKNAVDLYGAYLAKVKTGGRVGDAADALGEMQHELDRLIASGAKVSAELAAEHTRLIINATLGNEVSRGMQEVDESTETIAPVEIVAQLDGKPAKPFSHIKVIPGPHTVTVSAPGYFPVTRKENVAQGQTAFFDIRLEPQPAVVTLATESGARVSLDGRSLGTTPIAAFDVAAGKHVITIVRRGRDPIAREITVGRGEKLTVEAPLQQTTRRRIVPWLLGASGVALAGSVTNIVLAVVQDGRASDRLAAIRMGNQDRSIVDEYNDARTYRGYATVGAWTLGGAAVGLATVGLLLFYTDTPSSEGVRVEPYVSADGGGTAVSVRF